MISGAGRDGDASRAAFQPVAEISPTSSWPARFAARGRFGRHDLLSRWCSRCSCSSWCATYSDHSLYFSVSSHLIVTERLALLVFFTVRDLRLLQERPKFLGCSYLGHSVVHPIARRADRDHLVLRRGRSATRVRLFGNILAGHIVLKVFAGWWSRCSAPARRGRLGAVLPSGVTVALTGLELLVAVSAGLRLRDPHLRLPQRRAPSRPLAAIATLTF